MPASLPDAPPVDIGEGALLGEIFRRLEVAYGAEKWHWYAEHIASPIDVVAGAILVQHTAWQNAERALEALRDAGALDVQSLAAMPDADLQRLIRVSGTPSIKSRRLRAIATTILDAGGLDAFLAVRDHDMRARLLATHGVGEETADAIMLYAAHRRVFEVDAYAKRIFTRIGLGPGERAPYAAWQRWFEERLPNSSATDFQRYHAQIVLHGKGRCRARPLCASCPLFDLCAYSPSASS